MEHIVTNRTFRAFQFTEKDTLQDVLNFISDNNDELYDVDFTEVVTNGVKHLRYIYLGHNGAEYDRDYSLDDGDWIVCTDDGGHVYSHNGFVDEYDIIKD